MTAIVRSIALSLIELISLLLFVRAILSWFAGMSGSKFYDLLCYVKEPFLMPYRILFDKLGIGQGFPIDLSFLATVFTLQLLTVLL